MFKRPLITILTPKRLHVYPRIILITTWVVMGANLLLHQGWKGGLGQIIGVDFITFYGAGLQYQMHIGQLYDINAQDLIQRSLIFPTIPPGITPFINPPHVALAYSFWTLFPLLGAFLAWSALSLGLLVLSVYLLARELPRSLGAAELSKPELLVVLVSSFPFFMGWQVGQTHSLTLLLMTGILICCLRGFWFSAGLLAGLLTYKPQYALGFIIIWLVWRRWPALLGFGLTSLAWAGIVLAQHGLAPFWNFLQLSSNLLYLPVTDGHPVYLQSTLYSLLASLIPRTFMSSLVSFSPYWLALCAAALAWVAFVTREKDAWAQLPAWLLAIMFPFIAAPHALTHDLLLLAPVMILFYLYSPSKKVLLIGAGAYLAAFILPVLGYPFRLALPALIPLGVFVAFLVAWLGKQPKPIQG